MLFIKKASCRIQGVQLLNNCLVKNIYHKLSRQSGSPLKPVVKWFQWIGAVKYSRGKNIVEDILIWFVQVSIRRSSQEIGHIEKIKCVELD